MMRDELGGVVERVLSPVLIPLGYRLKAKNKGFGYSFEFSGHKADRLQLISVDICIFGELSFCVDFYNEGFYFPLSIRDFFRLHGQELLGRDLYYTNLEEFEDWLLLLVRYVQDFESLIYSRGIAYLFFKDADAIRERGIDGFSRVYLPAKELEQWKEVRAKEVRGYLERYCDLESHQTMNSTVISADVNEANENKNEMDSYCQALESTIIKSYSDKGFSWSREKALSRINYRLIKGNGDEIIELDLGIIAREKEAVNLLTIYINGYNLWYLLLLLGIRVWSSFAFNNVEELAGWIMLFEPYVKYFSDQLHQVDRIRLHREVNWLLLRQHYLELRNVPWKAGEEREFQLRARNFRTMAVKDIKELRIMWRSETSKL